MSGSGNMRWHLFCRVIDNFGDAGVAWRLARELAREHGAKVTLWIDAPDVLAGIGGTQALLDGSVLLRDYDSWHSSDGLADVVVELFGCGLPPGYLRGVRQAGVPPRWFVLEHLSAESWVDGVHGLPSPEPASGIARTFWFPGFTPRTGGLLRERDLFERRDAFARNPQQQGALWHELGVDMPPDALRVSLFCYASAPVASLLAAWEVSAQPVLCVVPDNVAAIALEAYAGARVRPGDRVCRGALDLRVLPFVTQDRYDEILWSCDVNFVRGEDSFVRAQWAARPLVWHVYVQEDRAHLVKLDAFMDRYATGLDPAARSALRGLMQAWNDRGSEPDIAAAWAAFGGCRAELGMHARKWSDHLATLPELATSLARTASGRV